MKPDCPAAVSDEARGWVFYDGECPLCQRSVARWGGLLAARNFCFLPLQTPGTAERLGVSEEELRFEMKLQLADGRVLGGADAWAAMLRTVWWLWPLGTLMAVPGLHALSRAGYRWVARNRHCLGGACPIQHPGRAKPAKPGHTRHSAFFELP